MVLSNLLLLYIYVMVCFNLRYKKIDCLRFVMCPLLAPHFKAFFLAATINSTNETSKADSTCH